MKLLRKVMAVVVAVCAAVSMLLMSGCSTPPVAMTVDGLDYSTGEYIANLYTNYYSAYYESGLYQYASYGMDPWTQTFTYGEGDEAEDLELADYIVAVSKDSIVRQKAIKNMMEELGITVPQEDLDKLNEEMATYKESEMLAYGFNKENYTKMYIATTMEEQSLFYQLYEEGGQRAVPEADVREYFDNNFVAYKAITLSQADDEGNALSDADKEANRTTLQGYMDMLSDDTDMDAVIEKYNADTAEAEEETAETADTTETEEEVDNTQFADSITGDEKIVEAVLTVDENTAKIVEYTDSNDATYIALIYRLNVEEAGGEDYYEGKHDTVLYGMKFDEFDEEVKAAADALEVVYNERAIKMCDPKNFDSASE